MKLIYKKSVINNKNGFWCIYSHYDKNNVIESYVVHALKKISDCGFNIIFVSTSSSLSENSVNSVRDFCSTILVRDNIGYDFGSYKFGIEFLQKLNLNINKILITNDSVYGPFSDIKFIIKKSNKFDIYGLTDSIDINYHLQSYFIIYNKNVIQDKSFNKFWNSVQLLSSDQPDFKQKIIREYEVGGSQFFMKKGYKIGVEHSYRKIAVFVFSEFLSDIEKSEKSPSHIVSKFTLGHNLTHNYWKILIKNNFPYIKRELLVSNPTNTDISDWPTVVTETFNYDVSNIIDALSNQTNSTDFAYTSAPPTKIVTSLFQSNLFRLVINPHFKRYSRSHKLEKFRHYVFDEAYYLSCNPDVKASVEISETKSGLDHFIKYGHTEHRRYKLIRRLP